MDNSYYYTPTGRNVYNVYWLGCSRIVIIPSEKKSTYKGVFSQDVQSLLDNQQRSPMKHEDKLSKSCDTSTCDLCALVQYNLHQADAQAFLEQYKESENIITYSLTAKFVSDKETERTTTALPENVIESLRRITSLVPNYAKSPKEISDLLDRGLSYTGIQRSEIPPNLIQCLARVAPLRRGLDEYLGGLSHYKIDGIAKLEIKLANKPILQNSEVPTEHCPQSLARLRLSAQSSDIFENKETLPSTVFSSQSMSDFPYTSSIPFIQSCIKYCVSSHQSCNFGLPAAKFPASRYIDVNLSVPAVTERVYIKTLDESYVALSHCWGRQTNDDSRSCLLTRNHTDFQRALPLNTLSKVFVEAINLTRQLGIRFLWIDSLCIIQDSKADWLTESKKMEVIFGNAYCCLAATGFEDGTLGFSNPQARPSSLLQLRQTRIPSMYVNHMIDKTEDFAQLNPQYTTSPYLEYEDHNRAYGDLHMREIRFPCYHCIDEDLWTARVTKGPLNKRGWVVQERVLAPRIVHFTGSDVFWECRTCRRMDYFPGKMPDWLFPLDLKSPELTRGFFNSLRSLKYIDREISLNSPSQIDHSMFTYWAKVVEAYSHSRLTFSADRLVAISGIARIFGHLFNDRYVAGLWSSRLQRDLLWKRVEISSESHRPCHGHLPTWSWASLLVGVEMFIDKDGITTVDELVKIIDVTIVPKENSYTGNLALAKLELRARLIKTRMVSQKSGRKFWLEDDSCGIYQGEVAIDDPISELARSSEELHPSTVICLPVLSRRSRAGPISKREVVVENLILRRSDGDAGEYVRIGRFTSSGKASADWLLLNECSDLEDDEYEALRNGFCRISIV